MTMLRVFLALAVLTVAGCTEPARNRVEVGDDIVIVTLDDGTRCAKARVPYGVAISCDWGMR